MSEEERKSAKRIDKRGGEDTYLTDGIKAGSTPAPRLDRLPKLLFDGIGATWQRRRGARAYGSSTPAILFRRDATLGRR